MLSKVKYPVPERTSGRRQGTGGESLARIQKSKNIGSWCSKHFTAQKTLLCLRAGVRLNDFERSILKSSDPKEFGYEKVLVFHCTDTQLYVFSLVLGLPVVHNKVNNKVEIKTERGNFSTRG